MFAARFNPIQILHTAFAVMASVYLAMALAFSPVSHVYFSQTSTLQTNQSSPQITGDELANDIVGSTTQFQTQEGIHHFDTIFYEQGGWNNGVDVEAFVEGQGGGLADTACMAKLDSAMSSEANKEFALAAVNLGLDTALAKLNKKFDDLAAPKGGVCSFDGSTLVLTNEGLLPIKDVNTSMSVWSRDADTGEMSYKPIEAQYSNAYDATVSVTIRDLEGGAEQTIISNKIHPYFVQTERKVVNSSEGHVYNGSLENGHWVDASELQSGDRLLNDDATWAEVVGVEVEEKPLQAYNITVADFHTYFVAANDNAATVWVHNDCFDEKKVFDALGVNKRKFHRSTKPEILKEFRTDLNKTGVRNPDVGMNDAGNIVFRDPRTQKTILTTDVPISAFGD